MIAFAETITRSRRRRFLVEIVLVVMTAFVAVLFINHVLRLRAHNPALANSTVVRVALLTTALAFSLVLFTLRRRVLVAYGSIEIAVGLVMAWFASSRLLGTEGYAATISYASAVYVVIRGLTNLETWNTKRGEAERKRLEAEEQDRRAVRAVTRELERAVRGGGG